MGYRGKLSEKERAKKLRLEGFTMDEIASQLEVSKSSVSLWTRDVEFVHSDTELFDTSNWLAISSIVKKS